MGWPKQPGFSVVVTGDTEAFKQSRGGREQHEHVCAIERSFCFRQAESPLRGKQRGRPYFFPGTLSSLGLKQKQKIGQGCSLLRWGRELAWVVSLLNILGFICST